MKIFGLLIFFVLMAIHSKPAESDYWFCKLFKVSKKLKVKISVSIHILMQKGLSPRIPDNMKNLIGSLSDKNQYKQIVEQFDPRGAPIKVDNVTRINTPIQVSSIETLEDTAANELKLKQSQPELDVNDMNIVMIAADKYSTPKILEDADMLQKYPAIIVNEFDGENMIDSYLSVNKDLLSQDEIESLSSVAGAFQSSNRVLINKATLKISKRFEVQTTILFCLYILICKTPKPTLKPYPTKKPKPTLKPYPTKKPYPSSSTPAYDDECEYD